MFRITLEPVSFCLAFGIALIVGAEVSTNLLLRKICIQELNYTELICDNLNKSSDIFNEVQKRGNNFLMVSGWIESVPALVFSLFVGSLADKYGFKPFLLGPLIGMLVGDIAMLLNCIFIDVLPLEMFFFERTWAVFGGGSVFYLGVYGYGTYVTDPKTRATTLGRVDGFEVLGKITGTLLSPLVLNSLGATFNYAFKFCFILVATIYVAIMVKMPGNSSQEPRKNFNITDLFKPVVELLKTLFARRPNKLHWLLLVQFIVYAGYKCSYEEELIRFLYLQKSFGFTGTDYAYLTVFITSLNSVGLLIILPILSQWFRFHDTAVQTLGLSVETLGIFAFAFSATIWQVYVSIGILEILAFIKFGLIRSIISKCVESNETGKFYSALAIIASIFHLIGSVLYRQVYNATLATFPAAEIVMKGIIYTIGSASSFMLFLNKWRIEDWNRDITEAPQIQNEHELSHM